MANDFRDSLYEVSLSNELRGFARWKQLIGMFFYGILKGILNAINKK